MKETGILFTAPMVRALLDGSKTQTRRIVKGQADDWAELSDEGDVAGREFFVVCGAKDSSGLRPILTCVTCPYGQLGDRLWVRETFIAYGRWEARYSEKKKRDEWHFVDMTLECDRVYQYAADNPDVPLAKGRSGMPGWWTRPAIFMPRVACRILLEIVSVRVERLTEISESDAQDEGVRHSLHLPTGRSAAENFAHLWWSINGDGAWEANPWVWVVEFKRVLP